VHILIYLPLTLFLEEIYTISCYLTVVLLMPSLMASEMER